MAKSEKVIKESSIAATSTGNATHVCDHKQLYFTTSNSKPQKTPIGAPLSLTKKQAEGLGKRVKPLVEATDDAPDVDSIADQAKAEAADIIAEAKKEAKKIEDGAKAEAKKEAK